MTCRPRSAVPEVATARSVPAMTTVSALGTRGWTMPARHARPGSGSPRRRMSPPALMQWLVDPRSTSIDDATSADQPLTRPEGSSVPDAQASK